MDPLLSDEAAVAQVGANYMTARKEAVSNYDSAAESNELKTALAEYEGKAVELVELETKLQGLVDSVGSDLKSQGKRKRDSSS